MVKNVDNNNLKLTRRDANKWKTNAILFLIPLALLYTTSTLTILGTGEVITWSDFIPTNFVFGGAAIYILNTAQDYLRKLKDSLESGENK